MRAVRPVTERIEADVIERFLRTDVYVREDRRYRPLAATHDPFRAGELHRIDVSIGPMDRRPGRLVADIPLRHEDLQAAVGHRLTIVFTEPAILEQPVVRRLELPPVGSTRMARFTLPIPSSARRVRARIVVLHRGRVLQTAVLEGPTTADPERQASGTTSSPVLRVEADLRPRMQALDGRRRYHAAMVLNHASDGTPGGTTVVGNTAKAIAYTHVEGAVKSISETFSRAEKDHAFNRKLDSEASLVHLRQLAIDGHIVYEEVGSQIEDAFGGPIEYLQIVSTDPETLLPVEVCYDLPTPSPTATLCENWKAALKKGACDHPHTRGALGLAAVVCPSGFWGLSKVIERQATRDFTSDKPFWVDTVPKEGRQTLRKVSMVLWAGSDKVDAVEPGELERFAGELDELTSHHAVRVLTWLDWGERVKDQPPLLLLLSHTETKLVKNALEIAAAERLALGQIEYEAVIGMPEPEADAIGPIVLLLGCTTGIPLDGFQSYLVRFAKKGAPIVVGTIAPVLGRHASRTAEALIRELILLQAKQHGGDAGLPFGEALRTVRRTMMADGRLMAMSLASYGDADWRLSPGG